MLSANLRQRFQGVCKEVRGLGLQEARVEADLTWEPKPYPMMSNIDGMAVKIPGKCNIHRDDTLEFISTHATRRLWTNTEVLELFYEFCQVAGISVDYMGHWTTGLMVASVQERLEFAQGDATECFLILQESHVAGKGMKVSAGFNRLVCLNGMVAPVSQTTILGHGSKLSERKAEIEGLLNQGHQAFWEKRKIDEALANVSMDDMEAQLLITSRFGKVNEPWEEQPKIVKTIWTLYKGQGTGSEFAWCLDTGYGLLQAVTEYINWGTQRGDSRVALKSLIGGNRAGAMSSFQDRLIQTQVPSLYDDLRRRQQELQAQSVQVSV
jgi:hypothetical protein